MIQDQFTKTLEEHGDHPSFDLGEHPSEVMARRAVWAWMRSYWARGFDQSNPHFQPVCEEPGDTSIGAKA